MIGPHGSVMVASSSTIREEVELPATDRLQELRELYAPSAESRIVDVPEMAFVMVDGHGDPNTAPAYRAAVEALFAVSYAAKFAVKRAPTGVDFAVMPLEGLWWTSEMSTFTIAESPIGAGRR